MGSIRNGDFWSHIIPHDTSWAWKKLWRETFAPSYCANRWILHPAGEYKIATAFKWLSQATAKVNWRVWVWNKLNVPKLAFICWMVVRGRLKTRDKFQQFGICNDASCAICGEQTEIYQHLFFDCYFAKACIKGIFNWLQCSYASRDHRVLRKHIYRDKNTNKFRKNVIGACLDATVYHIWSVRNEACWNNMVLKPEATCARIMSEVMGRIRQCVPKKTSKRDRCWLSSL